MISIPQFYRAVFIWESRVILVTGHSGLMHFAPWFVAKTHVTFLVSEKQNEDNRVVFPRFSRDWSRLYAIAWFSWKSLYFCWLRTLFEQRGRISVFGVGSLIGGMFEAFAQRFLQHGAKKVRKELLWTLWNWCFVRLLTESGTKRALLSCCAIWDSTCFQVAWEARKVRNHVHEKRVRWSDERDRSTPVPDCARLPRLSNSSFPVPF